MGGKRTRSTTWRTAALACAAALAVAALASVAWTQWRASRPWALPRTAPDLPVPAGVLMHEAQPYCDGQAGQPLLLDWAEPVARDRPRAAVVLIHGGAWMHGSRWDVRPLMLMLAQQGFVGVAIDYRLAPRHPYPAPLHDAKCAVRWLRSQAPRLGVDTGRVAAWGESAGGHLAALLGTTAGRAEFEGQEGGQAAFDSRVQAVVVHGGLQDLAAAREAPAGFSADALRGIEALMGPSTDPQALRRASPAHQAHAGAAPVLIIHGGRDAIVPVDQAERLHQAMQAQRATSQLLVLPEAGHGDFGADPGAVLAEAVAFLRRSLGDGR